MMQDNQGVISVPLKSTAALERMREAGRVELVSRSGEQVTYRLLGTRSEQLGVRLRAEVTFKRKGKMYTGLVSSVGPNLVTVVYRDEQGDLATARVLWDQVKPVD